MAEQDFSEIAKLSERFNKDPKSRIFVQLADAYRKNNMVDEALQVINQGLQYHPEYPLAFLILGKCYYDRRQYGQAKEAIEKTLRYDQQNIVALRLLAQICDSLKDDACQLMAYRGVVAIDPFDAMAKDKLAVLEARQSKGPVFTLTLAEEYEKQGNLAEALKVYEQLQFTDPTDLVLKEKIKELKQKTSQPAAPDESPKPGNAFQPDSPLELASMVDIMQDVHGTLEPSAPEMKFEKIEPAVKKGNVTGKVTSDMDFIMESPKEKAPPVIEPVVPMKQPEPPPVVSEPPPVSISIPEPAITPPKSDEPQEVSTLDDFLVEAPKAEEPPAVKDTVSLVAEQTIEEQKPIEKIEKEETIESIESLLIPEYLPPAEPEPVAGAAPVIEIEKKEEPIVEKTIEPGAPPEPILATAPPDVQSVIVPPAKTEEKKAEAPVEPPPAKTEEKKAEAPAGALPEENKEKPKEEDFKSFQDWLSGLLK
ncbi:MAG TPA: tetratricopeptide repeat protein [bacterium]